MNDSPENSCELLPSGFERNFSSKNAKGGLTRDKPNADTSGAKFQGMS